MTPTIIFCSETVGDVWDEIQPLLEAHWREIAHYDDIPLEVDRAFYEAVERSGTIRVYTTRLDGRLVGYAVFFLRKNPHYASSLNAVQDILFVAKEHRKSRLGIQLIQFADDMLRAEGVQVVAHHVKAAHNFGPLLERLGYELQDLIYTRRLDR